MDLIDVLKPVTSNPGSGGGINSEIYLIQSKDIATFPVRDIDGVSIKTPIIMKSGKYARLFYMTQETIVPKEKKVKGENSDGGNWSVSVEGSHPGLDKAIQAFKANFGFNFEGYVLIKHVASNSIYLLGEPGNLVKIDDIDSTWNAKGKGTKFQFQADQSQPMAFYDAAIPLPTPSGV